MRRRGCRLILRLREERTVEFPLSPEDRERIIAASREEWRDRGVPEAEIADLAVFCWQADLTENAGRLFEAVQAARSEVGSLPAAFDSVDWDPFIPEGEDPEWYSSALLSALLTIFRAWDRATSDLPRHQRFVPENGWLGSTAEIRKAIACVGRLRPLHPLRTLDGMLARVEGVARAWLHAWLALTASPWLEVLESSSISRRGPPPTYAHLSRRKPDDVLAFGMKPLMA